MSKLNKYWALIIVFLIVVIITGGIIVWVRYSLPHPVEISLPPSPQFQGEIYIGGAVNNAGFYPLQSGDSVEALIGAAGGTTDDADLTQLKLYIPTAGDREEPQRIDINRAEVWLLEALPGIGPSKAQAIIDYRQQNGGFDNTAELTEVKEIGRVIYEEIKDLITVAD